MTEVTQADRDLVRVLNITIRDEEAAIAVAHYRTTVEAAKDARIAERLVALSLVCTPGLIVLDGVDIGKELRAMIAAAKEPTDD